MVQANVKYKYLFRYEMEVVHLTYCKAICQETKQLLLFLNKVNAETILVDNINEYLKLKILIKKKIFNLIP